MKSKPKLCALQGSSSRDEGSKRRKRKAVNTTVKTMSRKRAMSPTKWTG